MMVPTATNKSFDKIDTAGIMDREYDISPNPAKVFLSLGNSLQREVIERMIEAAFNAGRHVDPDFMIYTYYDYNEYKKTLINK